MSYLCSQWPKIPASQQGHDINMPVAEVKEKEERA